MARRKTTVDGMKDRIAELEQENDSLQEQLDAIADIVGDDEEGDE